MNENYIFDDEIVLYGSHQVKGIQILLAYNIQNAGICQTNNFVGIFNYILYICRMIESTIRFIIIFDKKVCWVIVFLFKVVQLELIVVK